MSPEMERIRSELWQTSEQKKTMESVLGEVQKIREIRSEEAKKRWTDLEGASLPTKVLAVLKDKFFAKPRREVATIEEPSGQRAVAAFTAVTAVATVTAGIARAVIVYLEQREEEVPQQREIPKAEPLSEPEPSEEPPPPLEPAEPEIDDVVEPSDDDDLTPPPTTESTPAPSMAPSDDSINATELAHAHAAAYTRQPESMHKHTNIGMSPEAAARLSMAKAKDDIIGRIEGRYKLLGKPIPLGLRNKSMDELELILAELRTEPLPYASKTPDAKPVKKTPPPKKGDSKEAKAPLNFADAASLRTNFAAQAKKKTRPRRKGLLKRFAGIFKRPTSSRALIIVDPATANYTFFPYKVETSGSFAKGSAYVAKKASSPPPFKTTSPVEVKAKKPEAAPPVGKTFPLAEKKPEAVEPVAPTPVAPKVFQEKKPTTPEPFVAKAPPPPADDVTVRARGVSEAGMTRTNFRQMAANRTRA